jgi:hypothetical protein
MDKAFGIVDGGSPDAISIVAGQIEIETPGLGVWVRVESITDPDGHTQKMERKKLRAATLIRWDWMIGAIAANKPVPLPPRRSIGFVGQ